MVRAKVAAVIQARMGSTRMPGKVLMPLAGKPLLWHIIHRLRKCRSIDVIAIATSDLPADDALVAFAAAEGVVCIRGPEENVLQRYAQAARLIEPDVIVRVTGDAPLIDPETIDNLVNTLVREDADYCIGDPTVDSIHEGFSPFSRRALERLVAEAATDPLAVEHVTAYLKEHPESFRTVHICVPPRHRFQGARMSVDTPADMRFMEEIYRRLEVPPGEADVSEIVSCLQADPQLLGINSHIYQKKASDLSRRVLVRCDGDARLGLGHVVRCITLAEELRNRWGCGVSFAMISGEPAQELVRAAGFPIHSKPHGTGEAVWLDGLVCMQQPQILIFDVKTDLASACLQKWRESGILTVVLDDPGPRRLAADMAFYPPVPQVRKLDWTGFDGDLRAGWEYVLLRPGFSARRGEKVPHRTRVLVTMGGSDPAGLTLKALRALDRIEEDFEIGVVIGAGFSHRDELEKVLAEYRWPVQLHQAVSDMPALMAEADLAVASFGMTAYELAAAGVPAIHLCLTEDHALSAEAFVTQGVADSCGVHDTVSEEDLALRIRNLIGSPERRRRMSAQAAQVIDDEGARRVANLILQGSKARHG